MYSDAQAAGRTAEQRQRDNMIIILQAGFFDYAAMIAEREEPEKAATSVKMLNGTIDLIRSADSESIEFTKAVLEDIYTMIELAEEEIKNCKFRK